MMAIYYLVFQSHHMDTVIQKTLAVFFVHACFGWCLDCTIRRFRPILTANTLALLCYSTEYRRLRSLSRGLEEDQLDQKKQWLKHKNKEQRKTLITDRSIIPVEHFVHIIFANGRLVIFSKPTIDINYYGVWPI